MAWPPAKTTFLYEQVVLHFHEMWYLKLAGYHEGSHSKEKRNDFHLMYRFSPLFHLFIF